MNDQTYRRQKPINFSGEKIGNNSNIEVTVDCIQPTERKTKTKQNAN